MTQDPTYVIANHMVGAMAISLTEQLMMFGAALTPDDEESPESIAWATETLSYCVATFLCRSQPGIGDQIQALEELKDAVERRIDGFHQMDKERSHGLV